MEPVGDSRWKWRGSWRVAFRHARGAARFVYSIKLLSIGDYYIRKRKSERSKKEEVGGTLPELRRSNRRYAGQCPKDQGPPRLRLRRLNPQSRMQEYQRW